MMHINKVAAILDKERGRILHALRQLDNSEEALQQQANQNAQQRAELRGRLAEIDEALQEPEDQSVTESELRESEDQLTG